MSVQLHQQRLFLLHFSSYNALACLRFNMFLYYQVQGWGETDPRACFQLQKQAKKCKANETANNCQFCLDLLQSTDNSIGQEAKTTRDQ